MEYKISILKDATRLPEIVELFKTGLGDTTPQFWEWRLFADNGQQDKPFAIIAEDENNRIVAMSSILTAIYGKENKYKCFQFCDWVVHPDYRGKGLIGSIYRFTCDYFQNKGYDFIIEFPNDMSYPIFKKYKFVEENNISSWQTSKNFFKLIFKEKTLKYKNIKFKFSNNCPFNNQSFSSENRIYRDSKFLIWKFDENPETKYHWLTLWETDKCIGYFVFTIHNGRIQTAVNVYDWEFLHSDYKILKFALKKLKEFGNYVSVWGKYPDNMIDIFLKVGLKKVVNKTRFVHFSASHKPFPKDLILTRIDTDY
ncbi:MAG: GNAT family N-acetyltransferase [Clostridia bacterium]|nr:GNAT family N-acetyltransferase [Clostridia bacterium]